MCGGGGSMLWQATTLRLNAFHCQCCCKLTIQQAPFPAGPLGLPQLHVSPARTTQRHAELLLLLLLLLLDACMLLLWLLLLSLLVRRD